MVPLLLATLHALEQRAPSFKAREWINVIARTVRGGTHAKDSGPLWGCKPKPPKILSRSRRTSSALEWTISSCVWLIRYSYGKP